MMRVQYQLLDRYIVFYPQYRPLYMSLLFCCVIYFGKCVLLAWLHDQILFNYSLYSYINDDFSD